MSDVSVHVLIAMASMFITKDCMLLTPSAFNAKKININSTDKAECMAPTCWEKLKHVVRLSQCLFKPPRFVCLSHDILSTCALPYAVL